MPSSSKSTTRSQNIAEILREKVLRGEFEAGARMQEIALAEQLGVSRTPVREALRSLAEDGLLDYAPNKGYRIRQFSRHDILISFRVRAAMEGLGCRMLAERGLTEEEQQRLQSILARGDELLTSRAFMENNHQAWNRMNRDFHVALLEMNKSKLLIKIARDAARLPIVNQGAFHWYSSHDFRHSHDQHHRIFDAIIKGDGERAEWWMREHIRMAEDIVARHI